MKSLNLRNFILRYGVAVVSIAVAIWVRLLLDPVLGNTLPYATLFVAVMLTAWYGGLRPAMLAVGLGAFAANYFLLPPHGSLSLVGLDHHVGLLLYLAAGLGIALIGGAMHAANERAETSAAAMREANEQLEARVSERTAELVRKNESIRTSEARMGGIVNSAMDAIISVDSMLHIVLFNAAAEKIFRCSVADAIGKSIDGFIPERFREQHHRHVEGFGKTGVTSRSMRSLGTPSGLRTDGEEFPIEASISQVEVGGERIFTVILRDLTERKRVEEVLRASEERFRIAAETANDVVYEWDLKQSVQWVGKIDEMLGYEPGEFARTLDGWAASVHPEDVERTMAKVQAHLEEGAPYAAEYRVRRKDGVYRWWSARGAVARTPDGKPVRWIGSITDITERKQAESLLSEQLDELQRWHTATLGRETRILDLKRKVNELLGKAGQPPRYASAESQVNQEE